MKKKIFFFKCCNHLSPLEQTITMLSLAFAEGTIGFMNVISPIGTKFQSADKMRPQSQLNIQFNYLPVIGNL